MNMRALAPASIGSWGCACAAALVLVTSSQAATYPATVSAEDSKTATHQRHDTTLGEIDRLYAEISQSRGAQDSFYRGTVIAADEMGQMRAGFNIGGLDVDFGARLQTLIDDRVEMVSVVNFTRAGADVVSQIFRDPSGVAIPVGPVGNGAVLVTDVTPGGVNLTGLADFSGIALNDAKGFTAALQNITRDAIISGVVSNASGRSIQQRIDIEVRLNNAGALQTARKRAEILNSFSGILR